jgi:hypothetical protein
MKRDKSLVDLDGIDSAMKFGTLTPEQAVPYLIAQIIDDLGKELTGIAERISEAAEKISKGREYVMEIQRSRQNQLIEEVRIKPVEKEEAETILTPKR